VVSTQLTGVTRCKIILPANGKHESINEIINGQNLLFGQAIVEIAKVKTICYAICLRAVAAS